MKNYFAFVLLLTVAFQFTSCKKDKSLDPPRVADLSEYPPEIFGTWKLGKKIEQSILQPYYFNVDHNGEKYYSTSINAYFTSNKTLFLSKDLKFNDRYSPDSISLNASYTGVTDFYKNIWHKNPDGTYFILCLSEISTFKIEKLTENVLVLSTNYSYLKITYYFYKNTYPFLSSLNQLEQKLLGKWILKTRTNGSGTVIQSFDTTQVLNLYSNESFSPVMFFTDTLFTHAFYGSSNINIFNDSYTNFLGANKWYCRNEDHLMIGISPSKIISLTDNNLTVQTYSPIVGEVNLYNFER